MVKQRLVLSALLAGGVAAAFLIPKAVADPMNDPVKDATKVTFNLPVEIPGMVLLPGTYVIKVPDPSTHSDMVGFYDPDQAHLYKLVRTIPAYRLHVTDRTVITFEERAGNAPQAIKQWFYPGDQWGKEFIYGKAATLTASAAAPAPAPPAPAPIAAEPAPEPAPVAAAPEPAAPAAPVEVAQATPPPAPEPAPQPPAQQLPQTASPMPLIALLGLSSLALGGLLKWLPKRGL